MTSRRSSSAGAPKASKISKTSKVSKTPTAQSEPPADYYYLETIEQLQVLADPLRYRIAILLGKPKTGAQIARQLEMPRAKVHYHLKVLESAKLIRLHSLDHSQGITEKYYVLAGRLLSFERLMPDPETLDGSTVTAATYKAVADFLASMLSVSRERILRAPADLRKDEGFWVDFTGLGTPREIARIRRKLIELRNDILAITRKGLEQEDPSNLTKFSATLYLTPIKP
ncbi:Helix-turn-helix domain-containing protein [Rhizobiales bacterium GAS113]|nr:Helix-turn-helix domain-containing protein [Rhizobiales bacterium GAS113]